MAETKLSKTQQQIIGAVLITALVILVLTFAFSSKDKPPRKLLGPPEYFGEIPQNWYPDDVTSKLYQAIEGIDSPTTKDSAWRSLNNLNDNQIIMVYNDFNEQHTGTTSWGVTMGTLTEAVRNEWDSANASHWIALGNLERLKLP